MKFIHLSDLHIGKRVNGFSMLEDQKYILDQILMIAEEEMPDGVLIAGDIYDKPVPPAAGRPPGPKGTGRRPATEVKSYVMPPILGVPRQRGKHRLLGVIISYFRAQRHSQWKKLGGWG